MPFGYSCILEFRTTSEKINDHEFLLAWVRDLVKSIGMEIHDVDGKPGILVDTWAARDMPTTYGTSIVGFLTSSSFSVHTAVPGYVMLDVFSCRDFFGPEILEVIRRHWGDVSVVRWSKTPRGQVIRI